MEIKISKKPVKYEEAIEYLNKRVHQVSQNKNKELRIRLLNYQSFSLQFALGKNELRLDFDFQLCQVANV